MYRSWQEICDMLACKPKGYYTVHYAVVVKGGSVERNVRCSKTNAKWLIEKNEYFVEIVRSDGNIVDIFIGG